MYRPLHFVPSPSIKIERDSNDTLTVEVAAFSKHQIQGLSHLSEQASFMLAKASSVTLVRLRLRQLPPSMSVYQGRTEVIGAGSERRN
jgi:hypothetical protein